VSTSQPFVSVAVGVILFEAGLRLSFRDVTPRIRPVVMRLVSVGLVVTRVAVAGSVALLFGGLGVDVPLLIGAILVVSGPAWCCPCWRSSDRAAKCLALQARLA
jgi:NhaP-type Na+/H+ or K+/H+ antiporter